MANAKKRVELTEEGQHHALFRKRRDILLVILSVVVVGALTLWLVSSDAREFKALRSNALCVVNLPEGSQGDSVTFTTGQSFDMFHVGVRTNARDEMLSISITGDEGIIASATVTSHMFKLGRNIEPGTYTITVRQEETGKGGEVVIAGEQPVYVTGWQIWSRTYISLLILSGIVVVLWRKSWNPRVQESSVIIFHSLLLGSVLIFIYLLFHESGHALAQIIFGRFDLARSDFFGIYGNPHSGGTMGPMLEPWKQTVISCAGPMMPTLVGFGLFILWSLPPGKKLRSVRPIVSLYFSAIVAGLVFSEAVCEPLYLLGLITAEGNLISFVAESGGPVWLAKSLLLGSFLISMTILWRVLPEVGRSWKAQFLQQPM